MGSGLCVTCSKADAKSRQKPVWERELTSREDALKAVRFAACCYFGLAALDFIVASFGEPFLYVTALVIVVCASLVWSVHSRVAAVTLLGLFVFDIIALAVNWFTSDQKQVPYVSFLLLTFQAQVTVQAVRSTFRLHKEYRLPTDEGRELAANRGPQSNAISLGVPPLLPMPDTLPPPLPLAATPALPTNTASVQGHEPATPPLPVQKAAAVPNKHHPASVPISQLPSGIAAARKRVTSWFTVATNRYDRGAVDCPPLWNPLAVICGSLIFTPAWGSALVYLNWTRLGRVKRARGAAVWFWGGLAWLAISTVAPPAFLPPLWAYLVFFGAWVGLVAYPQHLSFATKFTGTGYRRAPRALVLAAGCVCMSLWYVLHLGFARLYQPASEGTQSVAVAAVPTPASTPAIDEANRLFSAEEITQRYRTRIVEVGVSWKESSGFVEWLFSSNHPGGSQGSGLLLANDSEAGLVVTNYHVVAAPDSVVEGSYRCAVRQDGGQEDSDAVCIAQAKPPLDLALLAVKMNVNEWKPDAVQVQPLDNLHQGESVVAIGNALGEGISTTNGVISHFDPLDSNGHYYIRTSTPISPGNSGGPLFTSRGGFFAGITTATRNEERAQNYNVAIPAEYILDPNNWDFANSEARGMAEPLLKVAGDRVQR